MFLKGNIILYNIMLVVITNVITQHTALNVNSQMYNDQNMSIFLKIVLSSYT